MGPDLQTQLVNRLGDPPENRISEEKSAAGAAILGRDFPGVKFEILVKIGDRVASGDALLRDRRRPDILFTAPLNGTVSAVSRGAKRALLSIQVTADDAQPRAAEHTVPAITDRPGAREFMLRSGLWTTLRTRPFGHIPDPDAEPAALLITAMDTEPLAPDPAGIIAVHAEEFNAGLMFLPTLSDAPLYLCQGADARLPAPASERIRVAKFDGPHPAGLPGTHIWKLCPIGLDKDPGEVWHIGYQDIIALGHLIVHRTPRLHRVVSIAGPAVQHPRTLTVPMGANVDDLLAGELGAGPSRIISGSVLSGHTASGAEAFLGQRHNQITVLPEGAPDGSTGTVLDTGLGGEPGPLLPIGDLQRAAPPGVLPVPLMRALVVGDVDRARDLGALELVEEDLALITYCCPSKYDYGALLRGVLDQLYKETARA